MEKTCFPRKNDLLVGAVGLFTLFFVQKAKSWPFGNMTTMLAPPGYNVVSKPHIYIYISITNHSYSYIVISYTNFAIVWGAHIVRPVSRLWFVRTEVYLMCHLSILAVAACHIAPGWTPSCVCCFITSMIYIYILYGGFLQCGTPSSLDGFFDGTSHQNGWFRASPISENLHIIIISTRNIHKQ